MGPLQEGLRFPEMLEHVGSDDHPKPLGWKGQSLTIANLKADGLLAVVVSGEANIARVDIDTQNRLGPEVREGDDFRTHFHIPRRGPSDRRQSRRQIDRSRDGRGRGHSRPPATRTLLESQARPRTCVSHSMPEKRRGLTDALRSRSP